MFRFTSFKELIKRNLRTKILSVVCSVVLFIIVKNFEEKEMARVVQIKIVPLPDMAVVGPTEKLTNATIKIHQLFPTWPSEKELMGELHIKEKTVGKFLLQITRECFPNLDKKYEILFEKPYVEVELDHLISKEVPIKPVLQGSLKEELTIDKIKIEPSNILLVGPKKKLKRIKNVTTHPISMSKMTQNINIKTKIAWDSNEFPGISLSNDKINVQIQLSMKKNRKILWSMPIDFVDKKKKIKIECRPKTVNIEIEALPNIIKKISPSDIHAQVELGNLEMGWQDRDVHVLLPKNVSCIRIIPNVVTIKYTP